VWPFVPAEKPAGADGFLDELLDLSGRAWSRRGLGVAVAPLGYIAAV